MKKTEQEKFWEGNFGDEYTIRNVGDWDAFYKSQWGVTRTSLNEEFLTGIPHDARILEIGCNRGNQLQVLEKQGFTNLWGIEINKKAIEIARENKKFNIVEGSIYDIPFKEGFFNLAFTSGVLIHIPPENLQNAIKEIYRVSRKYIWCFEYFADECTEIEYRGHKNRLWKNNFLRVFQETFPDLILVKKRMVKYLHNENVDIMFLLEKQAP
ncbi:MAG: methyltransferase domain-containing protein [Candidatus Thorarchaeota archaeon]|nr:methyltransferase domain-containing protein [Candidatus Thorarchaeota archaeon]